MQSRGLPIHPDVLNAINQTHQAYVRSTVPGTGAMPHPGFRPPVERSQTVRAVPSGPKRLDASKISGDAVMSGEDESWAHGGSSDISAAQESNALMSRQIRDSLGY